MKSIIRFSFLVLAVGLFSCYLKLPKPSKPMRVVYVDMVADLFHPGHVSFLKKAHAMGDWLIVGLITDEDAESYNKRRPIMNLRERSEVVRGCEFVDEVIESPYRMTDEFLDAHKIDLVVHGNDLSMETLYHYYQPAIDRGVFRVVEYTSGISTSEIIERTFKMKQALEGDARYNKENTVTMFSF